MLLVVDVVLLVTVDVLPLSDDDALLPPDTTHCSEHVQQALSLQTRLSEL